MRSNLKQTTNSCKCTLKENLPFSVHLLATIELGLLQENWIEKSYNRGPCNNRSNQSNGKELHSVFPPAIVITINYFSVQIHSLLGDHPLHFVNAMQRTKLSHNNRGSALFTILRTFVYHPLIDTKYGGHISIGVRTSCFQKYLSTFLYR